MSDRKKDLSRRKFLGTAAGASAGLAGLTALNGIAPSDATAEPAIPVPPAASRAGSTLDDNIYTRLLGVRPHLPAHEHISALGGGRMSREVMDVMAEANEYYINMGELNLAAGKRCAELLNVEAVAITAGGFSGMILGAAACLTGGDQEKMRALPTPTWVRRECLMQTAHKFSYDRAFRVAGATVVYADTPDAMLAQLGERTAMIAGLTNLERQGTFGPSLQVSRAPAPNPNLMKPEELIAMGKKAGVPVLIDMASDFPPWENFRRLVDAGADLVVLSGGKTIGGPQSSGILAGRKDLIDAARAQASPNDHVGRGMKVGKEEIVGLVFALERYVKQDHVAEVGRWRKRAQRLADEVKGVAGVTAGLSMNTGGYEDAELTWDETVIPLNRDSLRKLLTEGSPRIELSAISKDRTGTTWHAVARTRLMREGEEVAIGRRLRDIFREAGAGKKNA